MSNYSNEDTSGPAFPPYWDTKTHPSGMSLRDWFAGMALQGIITSGCRMYDAMVNDAYTLADRMLEARKPTGPVCNGKDDNQ